MHSDANRTALLAGLKSRGQELEATTLYTDAEWRSIAAAVSAQAFAFQYQPVRRSHTGLILRCGNSHGITNRQS
jgi:hypothetical protein